MILRMSLRGGSPVFHFFVSLVSYANSRMPIDLHHVTSGLPNYVCSSRRINIIGSKYVFCAETIDIKYKEIPNVKTVPKAATI